MIVTPMEVIKIRLQQQQGGSKDLLKYKVGCTSMAQPCLFVTKQHTVRLRQTRLPGVPHDFVHSLTTAYAQPKTTVQSLAPLF